MYELSATEITCNQLRELFTLNEITGKFTRINDRYGRPYSKNDEPEIVKGTQLNNKSKSLSMVVKGRSYAYHRLVWLYVHGEMPPVYLGQLDGNKANTAPSNLALIPDGRRSLPKIKEPSFL